MPEHSGKRGTPRRAGKRKAKISVYYRHRYPLNKLKRILHYNGIPAAQSWAAKHEAEAILLRAKKEVQPKNIWPNWTRKVKDAQRATT